MPYYIGMKRPTQKPKRYKVRCAKCGKIFFVGEKPQHCTCGSRRAYHKKRVVSIFWDTCPVPGTLRDVAVSYERRGRAIL